MRGLRRWIVVGSAVIINFIMRSNDRFRNNRLRFVCKETIDCRVSVNNKIKPPWLKLFNASDCAIKINDVFFETIIRTCSIACVCSGD